MTGLVHALENADAIGPAIIVCMIVMWYGLSWRAIMLFDWRSEAVLASGELPRGWSAFRAAVRDLRVAAHASPRRTHARLQAVVGPHRLDLGSYTRLVQSTAMIAPLLGLLGTVMGMIETFSTMSAANAAVRGEGVARGIAEALTATELGLVVAVPGLLLGSLLDRRQHALETLLDREVDRLAQEGACS